MSSPPALTYASFTEARKSLKHILDAAENGAVVSIERGERVAVVADRDRMRELLVRAVPSRAQVVAENDAWVVLLESTPIAAEGDTLEGAVDELIANLREYAAEWETEYRAAPNHADNWALVQLVTLSSDEQVRTWLLADQA